MTLRLLSIRLILLVMLAPLPVLAQQPKLTRSSERAFEHLTDAVAAGALGKGVVLDNIVIQQSFARIEAHAPAGAWTATLTPAQGKATTAPRWFAVEIQPSAAPVDRAALGRLLDEAFPESPWMLPRTAAKAPRYRSFVENFQDDRAMGRVPRFEGTAARGYVVAWLIVVGAALAGVLCLLVWVRPQR